MEATSLLKKGLISLKRWKKLISVEEVIVFVFFGLFDELFLRFRMEITTIILFTLGSFTAASHSSSIFNEQRLSFHELPAAYFGEGIIDDVTFEIRNPFVLGQTFPLFMIRIHFLVGPVGKTIIKK